MILLRKAEPADAEGICRVHVGAIRGLCSTHYTPQQITSWSCLLDANAYSNVLRTREMIVACDDDRVVGFGQLNVQACSVEAVYVDPAYVHRGIGKQLLSRLHEIAAGAGISSLHLCATLNAVGFYERNGYRTTRQTVYKLKEFLILDCVEMAISLEKSAKAAQT